METITKIKEAVKVIFYVELVILNKLLNNHT